VRLNDADHDAVGLIRIARPVDMPAGARARLLEHLEIRIQVTHHVGLDLAGRFAQFLPIGQFGDHLGTLAADDIGRASHVVAKLGIGQQLTCRARKFRRAIRLADVYAHAVSPESPAARISAMCMQRTPVLCRLSAPPICIRHELSMPAQTSARVP
jgi:hypothetical protein